MILFEEYLGLVDPRDNGNYMRYELRLKLESKKLRVELDFVIFIMFLILS